MKTLPLPFTSVNVALKKSARHTVKALTKRDDYIFLDLNRDVANVKRLSNAVAVVLDNDCLLSIWSVRYFYEGIQNIKPDLHIHKILKRRDRSLLKPIGIRQWFTPSWG
ncbi:hypothetical protein [Pseudomonas syringae group genomosp. 7]|uniref:hypothetical protein n=1 Tax=Pseudomonas syringae group genomosp. 7 TaxID=251699 RepID=UPI0006D64DED|nr:hypothetical protein [Pseudomonas syringae group genomosp. 7]UNB65687.1 hypothetical protein MME54_13445 [Pseudomonas syringae pv. helianthi]